MVATVKLSRIVQAICVERNPRDLLIEMVDTTFLVQFRAPGLGAQSVIAARAEVRGEHLLLLRSNGQLAAAFMLENVKSWSEV